MNAVPAGFVIIGFGVRPEAKARAAAERDGVEIRTYSVIYKAIEEINAGHEGIAQTVVYGTSQRLSPARLKRGRIDFKQIPYNLRIS